MLRSQPCVELLSLNSRWLFERYISSSWCLSLVPVLPSEHMSAMLGPGSSLSQPQANARQLYRERGASAPPFCNTPHSLNQTPNAWDRWNHEKTGYSVVISPLIDDIPIRWWPRRRLCPAEVCMMMMEGACYWWRALRDHVDGPRSCYVVPWLIAKVNKGRRSSLSDVWTPFSLALFISRSSQIPYSTTPSYHYIVSRHLALASSPFAWVTRRYTYQTRLSSRSFIHSLVQTSFHFISNLQGIFLNHHLVVCDSQLPTLTSNLN